jgi:hypothetical protein
MGPPLIGKRCERRTLRRKWMLDTRGWLRPGKDGKCRIRRIVFRLRWGWTICSSESSIVSTHSGAGMMAAFRITDRNRTGIKRSVDIHPYSRTK